MKNKKNKTGFLYRNFLEAWKYVGSNKNYLWLSIGFFVLFAVIAIVFPIPSQLEQSLQEMLRKLAGRVIGLNTFETIALLFTNNFFVSLVGLFSGLIFCIGSFMIAMSNGYVIGYVIKLVIQQMGLHEGIISLWRLLPHGIFEIPAIMISLAVGLRLGVSLFNSLNAGNFKGIFDDLKNAVRVSFFVILPLLVIAAIIEGMLIGFGV